MYILSLYFLFSLVKKKKKDKSFILVLIRIPRYEDICNVLCTNWFDLNCWVSIFSLWRDGHKSIVLIPSGLEMVSIYLIKNAFWLCVATTVKTS